MNKNRIRWILWSLVIIWMVMIFIFSAQPSEQSSALSGGFIQSIMDIVNPDFEKLPPEQQKIIIENFQHITRKAAHLLAYTVLGILCMTALQQHAMMKKKRMITAFLICICYAVTDEVHQLFVSGRSAQVTDVCIDSLGALIGIGLVISVLSLWQSFRIKNKQKKLAHMNL